MTWVVQKPRSIVSLDDAPALFKTAAPHLLATGYAELMRDTGGEIPRKTGLDISKFASALSDMALFAVTMPDQCVYRVVGEDWKNRIGINPTGKNYFDFVAQERRESAVQSLRDVVALPSAFRVVIEQRYSGGRTANLEVLAVPLRSDEPGVDGFTVFAAQLVSPLNFRSSDDRMVLGANIIERDLIDIGFGVNGAFVDIVRPR